MTASTNICTSTPSFLFFDGHLWTINLSSCPGGQNAKDSLMSGVALILLLRDFGSLGLVFLYNALCF